MKKTYATSIVIALAALSAGQAMAGVKPAGTDIIDPTTGVNITQLRADFNSKSGVTREQVQAELLADRAANKADVIDPTTGMNLSELRNLRSQTNGKSRAQVQAELAAYQAEHRNDVVDPTTGFQIR